MCLLLTLPVQPIPDLFLYNHQIIKSSRKKYGIFIIICIIDFSTYIPYFPLIFHIFHFYSILFHF